MTMPANVNIPLMTIVLFFTIVSSSIGAIPQCGTNTNCCQTAAKLFNAGLRRTQLHTMTAIAYYESTWGTRRGPNRNNDGSTDNGLFQINSYMWCSASGRQNDCCCPGTANRCRNNSALRTCASGCSISCSQALTDDASNIQCATTILRRQGYTAWVGYKNHVAECNSYNVFNGRCARGSCCSALYPGSVCCPALKPNTHGCCPSTHRVCCPVPYQDTCCPSGYPVCCGTHCCLAGWYCCGNEQCCPAKSSNGQSLGESKLSAASVTKH